MVLFIYANNKRKWTFRMLKPLTLDAALLIIFGWTLIWRVISCAPVRRGKIVLSSSMWSLYTQISDTLSNSNVFIYWGSRKVISCWFDNIFANISNLVFFSLLLFCIVCLHIIFFNWKIYLHLMFCLKIQRNSLALWYSDHWFYSGFSIKRSLWFRLSLECHVSKPQLYL